MRKRDRVKQIIMSWDHSVYTVNTVHRMITGRCCGAQWHEPLLECSMSTIRRAFEELEREGEFESYFEYGHCYDPIRWRRLNR